MRTTRWRWLRAAVVVFVALILQVTVMADLRVAGALGDLMLVLVVAAGLAGGPERGATYGLVLGVAYDLMLATPFGLSALTYALVGYAVGLAALTLGRTGGWWPVLVAALAGLAEAGLYTALGNLVGVAYPFGDVPAIGLVQAAWCAVLVLPALRVIWWIHGQPEPDRLELVLR